MEILLCVGFCLIVGIALIRVLKLGEKPAGTFVIDFSDPTKDVCRLELDVSLSEIYSKKRILLNIKTYEDNSPN